MARIDWKQFGMRLRPIFKSDGGLSLSADPDDRIIAATASASRLPRRHTRQQAPVLRSAGPYPRNRVLRRSVRVKLTQLTLSTISLIPI